MDRFGSGLIGGILAALAMLVVWVVQPVGVNPPAPGNSAFDTDRAIDRLTQILGDETPHPVDSPANDQVRARLLAQIRALGLDPIERDQFHCSTQWGSAARCARVRNVAFWVTPPGDDAIMLSAHYDSVPAGPGAADDGIGVAVALELAELLQDEPLDRPVLVLITDGEEAGLIGASAFAAEDPLASRVGAVVNMEARGTTGIASMFQTSTPNGHDIAALAGGKILPAANSLATDIYEAMPNDTDLTVLLPLGVDAANYAIIGGGQRYHTPLDDLAHLDRRSVAHMGASALSAVRGFAGVAGGEPEGQKVYTDFLRLVLFVMPQWLAGVFVGLGLLAAVTLFWKSDGGRPVRSAITPPLAVVAGVGLAIGATALIAALRADTSFAAAYPAALRTVQGAAAICGASLVIALFGVQGGQRLSAAAWGWLGVLVLAGFAVMPGLSTLAVWPLIAVIAAALFSLTGAGRRFVPLWLALAAIVFALIIYPIAGVGESGLFIENAAPLCTLLAFLFLFAMPRAGWILPAGSAATLLIAVIAALMVPAYSPDVPRHLTIIHLDDDGEASFLLPDNGPVPPGMAERAAFTRSETYAGNWQTPAPAIDDTGTLSVISRDERNGQPIMRIRLNDPMADQQSLWPSRGAVSFLEVKGVTFEPDAAPDYLSCSGRTCRDMEVTIAIDPDGPPPRLIWQRYHYGAGPAAQQLVAGRPADAQPVHTGDRRTILRSIVLQSDETKDD